MHRIDFPCTSGSLADSESLLRWFAAAVTGTLDGNSQSATDSLLNAADTEAALSTHSDPDRFLEIYQRHYSRILNYLYRRTGDRELARDLTSRTFLAALADLRQRPHEELMVRPWLYRVATNAHLDHCRAQTRWLDWLPHLCFHWQLRTPPLPDARLIQSAGPERVRQAIGMLRGSHQTVLVLHFYEELPYEEIAAVMGVVRVSVRSRVSRALKALRQQLESVGDE